VLDLLHDVSDRTMSDAKPEDDLREEYDFSHGVRGKYAQRFAEGANVIVLDPDVAETFKTSKEVNDALRKVMRMNDGGEHGAA
jgi:hypothetical protein